MTDSNSHRILMMVENNSYPGDPRVYREATTLVAAGYRVSVDLPREPPIRPRGKRSRVSACCVIGRPRSGEGLWGFAWEYGYSLAATLWLSIKVLLRGGFDVIHCHNPPDLFVFLALPYKLLGKKFVFDHHDLAPEMFEVKFGSGGNRKIVHAILLWLERLSCRWADHVIATNESYRRSRHRAEPRPPAADHDRPERTGPRTDPTARAGRRDSGPGRHDPRVRRSDGTQDGLDYLLRALQHLRGQLNYDDFYCVLIGGGDDVARLVRLAGELDLQNHVGFAGVRRGDELCKYLSAADICVDPDPKNPYNDRSTMIKMAEYMALAKPIVAFDLTEHRATAGEAALYAKPNDEHDFARLILQPRP